MAVSFINNLNEIISLSKGENSTAEVCQENLSHYAWYQFALIPAGLVTLTLAFTKQRRNVLRDVWAGRPALIYPMDTLTRTSRISYACAFGATAVLVYQIVLDQKAAIEYTGDNKAVRTFVLIGSMFIYGMVFFPLFTSLAVGSVLGYFLGTFYAWMLTAMELYRFLQCLHPVKEGTILLLFRNMPSLLCLSYLCLSLPVRAVWAWRRRRFFRWRADRQEDNLSDVRKSYVGLHVINLFRKPKIKLPPEVRHGRIVAILLKLVYRFVYKKKSGFRYPARLLSVLFTACVVVYTVSFQFLALFPRLIDTVISSIDSYIAVVLGTEQAPGEDPSVTELRDFLWALIKILEVINACFIVSVVTAALFAVFNILHTLSSYRANLFALYKGDHSRIPPASSFSNTSHCVNSIKFAGFQVGYIVWTFLIHFTVLLLVSLALSVLILLILYDFTGWLIIFLEFVWPIVVTFVTVWASQFLLAKFVFLQERGGLLALDNRSGYFNFTYFMFFYNVFLGLASCFMRILKAMLVGVAFLGRLDGSTLPRRFEFFDPGFKAYVGFMHVEVAHTHPVMIVFCRLMLLGLNDKRDREAHRRKKEGGGKGQGANRDSGLSQASADGAAVSTSDRIELVLKSNRVHAGDNDDKGSYDNPLADTTTTTTTFSTSEEKDKDEQRRRRRVAARFNWHVTYTLLHNPDIRVTRKGYLQMLRRARAMGVYVPVSDRQADVNFDQLQDLIAEAQAKRKPASKKTKKKDGDGDNDEELTEVVTAVKDGDVKKATRATGPAGVLAAQMSQLVFHADLQEAPTPPAIYVPKAGQGAEETRHSDNAAGGEKRDDGTKGGVPVEDALLVRVAPGGCGQDSSQQGDENLAAASTTKQDTAVHM